MSQDRVRKCLSAMRVERNGKLVANDQRKSYFICLKMLGILPPPPKSDFVNWEFYTPARLTTKQNILYTPKCLHDVLISSHATSCQHNTLFFGYYHRHQMILLQIFLNLAHQILKFGEKALLAVYPTNDIYNKLNKGLWDDLFQEYKSLDLPDEIAGHYWNPTDFLSDQNLCIPEQLDWDWEKMGKALDNIDHLYFSINKCYPWEINVKRRWYNKDDQYEQDIKKGVTSELFKNYFNQFQTSTSYNQTQKLFRDGKLNPHDNADKLSIEDITFNPTNKQLKAGKDRGFIQNTQRIAGQSSYQLFLRHMPTLRLCPITKNRSLLTYGAKSKKAHYISIDDRKTKSNMTVSYRSSYNRRLPHVQYASSLNPNFKFKEFLVRGGFEGSHGTMHNNFGPILYNSVFSITSLIFFPYHSWIDAQLQFKIRQANTRNQVNEMTKQLGEQYSTQSETLNGVLKQLFTKLGDEPNQSMKSVAQFKLSGLEVDKKMVGYYPIFQWINPPFLHLKTFKKEQYLDLQIQSISLISAAFLSQDFIIAKQQQKQKIRDSTTLNDAYLKYFQFYKSRYSFFDDIRKVNSSFKFTPNHNYQVGSSPKDIETFLASDASNIPQYLNAVLQDSLKFDQAKAQSQKRLNPRKPRKAGSPPVKSALVEKGPSSELKAVGSPQVESAIIETGPSSDEEAWEEQNLQLRKVLDSSIQLFATYPVDSLNTNHSIIVRPNNVIGLLKEIFKSNIEVSEAEFSELQKFIKEGIPIDNIQIFGKANFADVCPRCKDYKNVYRSLGDSLRNASPKLWKYIHTKTLNEVLFDSNVHQPLNCIYQKLELIPNESFKDYRFVRGAEEIQINIIDKVGKSNKYVRIDAESYSVQNDSLQSVLSKKYKNFKTSFDFFKIFDVNQTKDSNYFDHYVYKQVKGTFIVNDVVADFSFQIPTFQRLLRLDITVHAERNEQGKVTQVNVRVEDRDYEKKLRFYESSYELLEEILENREGIDFQQ